ncbi:VCBS repeat-containing protein [Ottowia sp. GY511]|uniref:VCBS repeat-containing protein n=1 Tax=Ottowia flava TaxID=2675430 RepID=A0ABW4KSJ0_9BURK|nr:VCBS repeat-containing protein [Ottowia sp. GY511]TXK32968.1 VCBS repeat-containing protein [Ottowia sp. GY511]
MADGCKIVLVEHESGHAVLHQVESTRVIELDRKQVQYHPDSAKWLTDNWAVAAVERGQSLDIFSVNQGRLTPHAQLLVPFAPRDVVVLSRESNRVTLMATPYKGREVSIVEWTLGAKDASVKNVPWCDTPWHPALVDRAPGGRGQGAVAACLDGKKLMYVSAKDWAAAPEELMHFDVVARQARPSPSGKWVYVALEMGGRNVRLDMDTGAVQYLQGDPAGTVSVAPLADDLVVWGAASALYLQRLDSAGNVLETRTLATSGFPTELQVIDVNGDGERDLLVLNSAGDRADLYRGPIWERASEKK